jgi:hypothetical protein
MKGSFFILVLFTLISSGGCLKKDCPGSQEHSSLYDKWHWVQTSGGIAGYLYKAKPDSNVILNLSSMGTFERSLNGQVTPSGTFQLGTAADRYGNQQPIITFGASIPLYYEIRNDSLMTTDGLDDGFSSIYIRAR